MFLNSYQYFPTVMHNVLFAKSSNVTKLWYVLKLKLDYSHPELFTYNNYFIYDASLINKTKQRVQKRDGM